MYQRTSNGSKYDKESPKFSSLLWYSKCKPIVNGCVKWQVGPLKKSHMGGSHAA